MADHVGFAGLGAMGFGMATNMHRKGIKVVAYDLNTNAMERFAAQGGSVANNLREVASGCRKFFVMVATPAQATSVIFGGEKGHRLYECLGPEATLCIFSTLPPVFMEEVARKLQVVGRSDIKFLEAPVSGGVVGAEAGKLSIMIGGEKEVVDTISAELEAVSLPGRIFHCGKLGSASTLKMINQHLAGTHVVSAAEILAFATAVGLSPRETYFAIKSSSATSWIFGDRGLSMIEANWAPRSAVSIFTKDMGIVNEVANVASYPCPLASVAHQSFLERATRGYAGDDDASVVCNYEDIIGKKVCDEPRIEATLPTPTKEENPDILGEVDGVTVHPVEVPQISNRPKGITIPMNKALTSLLWRYSETQLGEDSGSPFERLPAGSVVIVLGFKNFQEAGEVLRSLQSKWRDLEFVDGHFVSHVHANGNSQLLLGTNNATTLSTATQLIGPKVTVTPVTGPLGAATALNQTIRLGELIHVAAAAECYGLAIAMGVSVDLVYKLIGEAAGSSHQFKEWFPRMIRQDYELEQSKAYLSISDAVDDLTSLQSICASRGFPARLLGVTHSLFKSVNRSNGGGRMSLASLVCFWQPPQSL